jgi:hypothetical protein
VVVATPVVLGASLVDAVTGVVAVEEAVVVATAAVFAGVDPQPATTKASSVTPSPTGRSALHR